MTDLNNSIFGSFGRGGENYESTTKPLGDFLRELRDRAVEQPQKQNALPKAEKTIEDEKVSKNLTFFGVDFSQPKNLIGAGITLIIALFIYKEAK